MERNAYPSVSKYLNSTPSDVSDDEWAFVAPYLTLMREVFNGLRWLVRAGAAWRMMPNDLPPWYTVYQQTQRWLAAGVFEAMVHDLRALLRLAAGRTEQPSAAIFDGRTLQSTLESGQRAGYDGHKRKKGSKTHIAVDTLGHLLALYVTPANEQERAQVGELAQSRSRKPPVMQSKSPLSDQGYTGDTAAQEAAEHGIELMVVKLPEAKNGFVLLPKRWVVEPLFRDWKSYGFDLEVSQLDDTHRLDHLLIGMAVATLWLLHLGHWVIASGRRTWLEAYHRHDYSLFRLGRDYARRSQLCGWDLPICFQR